MKNCRTDIPFKKLANQYGTPLYIYDLEIIKKQAETILSAFKVKEGLTEVYFAMKSNCHPVIVKLLSEMGLGMDCVSPGELEVALKCGVKAENILFTGNYESPEDLQAAVDSGAKINLDDINSLERLLKIQTPEFISFRINPGKGRGKFEQITTGGEKAKFGIPFEKAGAAYLRAKEAGVKRFGAHMMTGSQVLDEDHFPTMMELLLNQLGDIRKETGVQFEFVDMGGGIGIPYHEDETALDIQKLAGRLFELFDRKVKELDLGSPKLAMEPGRFFVGESGYLATRVLGIKESYRKFVGIDAGFNTLVRPALYKATHDFWIAGKENAPVVDQADICGQICENTDILLRDAKLPEIEENDLMIISQAGAYGQVMSMPYNLRMRPAEVAIENGKPRLITRRETMADFWNRIEK